MVIRKAKKTDSHAMYELTKSPEFIFPGGEKYVLKYLAEFIKKGITYVFEEKGKILGFISAQITLGNEMWIDLLVVEKNKRGQGIGTELMQNIFKAAKKNQVKMMFLDAPLFNKKTIKFYEKMGLKKEKSFVWFTKEF